MTDRRSGRRRPPASGLRRTGSHRARAQAPRYTALGEVDIERISHDGRGIGLWQGKTLFVENALPGERVQAVLLKEQGSYAEALATEVLRASPERIEPPCPHYRACGGCQLQQLAPSRQVELKQQALQEQLARWAGLAPVEWLPAISAGAEGYRQRARMAVWYEKDGRVTLGFRQRQSRQLVRIDRCLVLDPQLNRLLPSLHQWLQGQVNTRAVTHIELIADRDGPALVVRHVRALTAPVSAGLAELAREQNCRVWLQGQEQGGLTGLDGRPQDPRLHYALEDDQLLLGFHPQDFIQVNARINQAMVTQALALLAPSAQDRVLDLFCGIGNFTLPLARRCAQVIGVEGVAEMVARGAENARHNHLTNARFERADLNALSAQGLKRLAGEVSAVLLDPPRDGAKALVAELGQLSARRLVYVSCNPATLARDAKILAEQGYRLQALGVLDMFPHTAHIESMALFVL